MSDNPAKRIASKESFVDFKGNCNIALDEGASSRIVKISSANPNDFISNAFKTKKLAIPSREQRGNSIPLRKSRSKNAVSSLSRSKLYAV